MGERANLNGQFRGEFTLETPPAKRATMNCQPRTYYDWDTLLDGRLHKLVKGKDFWCSVISCQQNAHVAILRRGKKGILVVAGLNNEGIVLIGPADEVYAAARSINPRYVGDRRSTRPVYQDTRPAAGERGTVNTSDNDGSDKTSELSQIDQKLDRLKEIRDRIESLDRERGDLNQEYDRLRQDIMRLAANI